MLKFFRYSGLAECGPGHLDAIAVRAHAPWHPADWRSKPVFWINRCGSFSEIMCGEVKRVNGAVDRGKVDRLEVRRPTVDQNKGSTKPNNSSNALSKNPKKPSP